MTPGDVTVRNVDFGKLTQRKNSLSFTMCSTFDIQSPQHTWEEEVIDIIMEMTKIRLWKEMSPILGYILISEQTQIQTHEFQNSNLPSFLPFVYEIHQSKFNPDILL